MGEKKGGLTNILIVLGMLVVIMGAVSLFMPELVSSIMDGMQGIVDNTIGTYDFDYSFDN